MNVVPTVHTNKYGGVSQLRYSSADYPFFPYIDYLEWSFDPSIIWQQNPIDVFEKSNPAKKNLDSCASVNSPKLKVFSFIHLYN